jgi:hypothetical protein
VDRESSGSLRERFLIDESMASAGAEILGVEADEAEIARKNRPHGVKSNGSLRERFAVDSRAPSDGEPQLQGVKDYGPVMSAKSGARTFGASATMDDGTDESDDEGLGGCKVPPITLRLITNLFKTVTSIASCSSKLSRHIKSYATAVYKYRRASTSNSAALEAVYKPARCGRINGEWSGG